MNIDIEKQNIKKSNTIANILKENQKKTVLTN